MAKFKGTMEEACRIGDIERVKLLISQKPERATLADNIGITPLHRACANNHMAIVELLIRAGADVNAVDKYGDAPLKKAAYSGHADVVNVLVMHGANVNYADQKEKLAIHHSAEQGQLQSVEAMIDHGADINAYSKDRETPLHLAAMNGHSWCCKAIIVAKAYIDARGGQFNGTALHMAAEGGHTHTVQLLIAEMADVNILDKQVRLPYLVSRNDATREAFDNPFVKNMCHAPSCTSEGPGVQPTPRADDACMFIIQPRDRYGVKIRDPIGLLSFTVDIEDQEGTFVPAKVIPNPRIGASVCYFDGSHSGLHYVHAYMEDFKTEGDFGPGKRVPIAGSPYRIVIQPAPLDPYNTRAFGTGVSLVVAGTEVDVLVHARDRFQNRTSYGQVSCRISPNNEEPLALSIVEVELGLFKVTYTTPPVAGTYLLTLAVQHDQHIYNSPFSLHVLPAGVDESKCSAAGRGLAFAGVGLPARLSVNTRDAMGNALLRGGLKVWAQVFNVEKFKNRKHEGGGEGDAPFDPDGERAEVVPLNAKIPCKVADLRNGVYVCEWKATSAGRHEVSVFVGDHMLEGSPHTVYVSELPECDAPEVALFVESVCGFPEYARHFLLADIRGFMLCSFTIESLLDKLAIVNTSHRRTIKYYIWEHTSKAVDPKALVYIDDHPLQQLGIRDMKARQRVLFALDHTSERTAASTEREELYRSRLKTTLQLTGERMQDEIRSMVETAMADGSDHFLQDFADGKLQAKGGVQARLSALEASIKHQVLRAVREATIIDNSDIVRAKPPDVGFLPDRRVMRKVGVQEWADTPEGTAAKK